MSSETGIVIPNGKGTGIVQVIDGITPPNVMPLLIPTFKGENL